MRTAYDSTTAADIPLSAAIVCGYVDGIYRWSTADWGRFPNAVHVPIACFATTNAGTVLDVETGDATPQQAPHWVIMRRAAGVDPTVYVNWSNWAATRQAFQQQQIAEPHYWLASYDGRAEIPAGTVAKQYANSALSGGHYDLSVVADHWPGVDSSGNAIAGAEVRIPQEETMALISGDGKDPRGRAGAIYATNGVDKRYIGSPTEVTDLLRVFNQAEVFKVSQYTVDRMPEIEGAPVTNPGGEVMQYSALAGVPAAVAAIKNLPSTVNLQPVLDAIHGLTLKAS